MGLSAETMYIWIYGTLAAEVRSLDCLGFLLEYVWAQTVLEWVHILKR